jgi:3-phenylpropionate/cinnamic acid dioxygenase small subunit
VTQVPSFEDWLEICNLKARYCRLLDTKDWDGWAALFTEDCEIDTRPAGGTLEKGRDTFVAMVRHSLADARTAHQIHSPEVTFHGDSAEVVWAMQDRVVKDSFALTGYGHYHETYVRSADGWKIAKQTLSRLIVDMAKT